METIFTRNNLVETLRNNIVTITFTKINGTERVMRCTLIPEQIGGALASNGKAFVESNDRVVAVWDLDNNGWRAFRVDSVKSISMG